jgi:hypothetical protein
VDLPTLRIRQIPAVIKRITTTDEGKVQIVLEGTMADNAELDKIRDLVMVQQAPVKVDILGLQGELDV